MDTEHEAGERIETIANMKGDIQFKNVSFAYEEGKEVVHNIDFHATPGSVTALVGTSGSGKSTIAGLAASFLSPESGIITVDGVNLDHIQLDNYRSHLGVVLQDDFLFGRNHSRKHSFPPPKCN